MTKDLLVYLSQLIDELGAGYITVSFGDTDQEGKTFTISVYKNDEV